MLTHSDFDLTTVYETAYNRPPDRVATGSKVRQLLHYWGEHAWDTADDIRSHFQQNARKRATPGDFVLGEVGIRTHFKSH